MTKTFYYRSHLKKMNFIFQLVSLVSVVVGIVFLFIFEGEDQLYGSLTMFGLALYIYLLSFVFKSMISTEITINDQGVGFKNRKKDFFIPFEEITKVDTRAIGSLGGYFVIEKNKKEKIKITIVLEHIHEFVKLLRDHLNERDLAIYDQEKLFKFYLLSYYSDTSWLRTYKNVWKIIGSFGLVVVMFILSAIYTKDYGDFIMAENIFKGYPIFFIGILFYYEFGIFSKDIKKNTNKDTWQVPEVDIDVTSKQMMRPLMILSILVSVALLYTIVK